MTHRINTILTDAWKTTTEEFEHFDVFDKAVHSLVAFVTKSSGIQEKLPKTLKKPSGTRPWRFFILVHDSILTSYVALRNILVKRDQIHRLLRASPSLLKEPVGLFAKFNKIFDRLEMSSHPTLQNVIPTYYLVVSSVCAGSEVDSTSITYLKSKIIEGMNEKYWSFTTEMHKIACLLDPSFKHLSFLASDVERREFIRSMQSGLLRLSNDGMCPFDTESGENQTKQICRSIQDYEDPFAAVRAAPARSCTFEYDSKLVADLKK